MRRLWGDIGKYYDDIGAALQYFRIAFGLLEACLGSRAQKSVFFTLFLYGYGRNVKTLLGRLWGDFWLPWAPFRATLGDLAVILYPLGPPLGRHLVLLR